MQIKNKKISELEEAQDMNGFFTIGYRIVNGVKTSLKFGLEKVQIAYDGMLAIKDDVLNAIRDIRSLEEVVETAEQDRKVEYGEIIQSLHSAGETSSAQTALAKTATDAANTAATNANNAANGIDAKMQAAIDALIAGAPDALDTLNELAAALGNDPNFATTVLNELGKKLNRTDIINDFTSGGIDKPFSAEMGKSLKSLLDTHNHDGKYQPISNDIAKVYNTTLDVFGIQDGSVVTKEQSTEVSNIMNKWNQGYIVTYVDTRQSTFHYGVLNVCRCDDGVPTTLSVINDRGDLLAYSFEPVGEATWTVTNKTSGGGTLFLTTPYLLDEGGELNASDSAVLNSLKGQKAKNLAITYCCSTLSGDESVPLKIIYDYSQEPFEVTLIYGGSLLLISEDENVVGKYTADPPKVIEPYKNWLSLNGTANLSDKTYKLDLSSTINPINGWYILEGSISYVMSSYTFLCAFSIPMKFNNSRPDRDVYNAIAICSTNSTSYPVTITFSSGIIYVKILSTLSFSYIAMNAPYCRLAQM